MNLASRVAASAPDAPLLELKTIAHRFGGFQVLHDVSFAVPAVGITGLMGPNGSGKTTLFNIISGFLMPMSGAVLFDGRNIRAESVRRRSLDGLVRTFQTPKVFERLTVAENVMVGAFKAGRSGFFAGLAGLPAARREMTEMRARAYETAQRFDLGAVFDRPSPLLTAGQRRLLELARAYQGRPRLLMLDEPSSGLTTTEIEVLITKLKLLAEEGIAILLVSHDMELMGVAQAIHVLNFGRIIASGTMAEVQEDAAVREAYLGV
ncbi:ABC transporter ATP-binding protein [Xanthobacter dioxanivorans]|uniref:ABC transporter ATP-binding protein n=1 Tax=Xanthobacter dioxanivorans TaxID=2528964 RepID=A0A974PTU2_9HYPH|nr:ABC transporter ATP-binding protein [Xanthobacter dioxanivorans]QRG09289.1 ABC transporter ATP-binding protein [Xanthobacter dioxanivorans]